MSRRPEGIPARNVNQGVPLQIDKNMVLELLRSRGQHDQAGQAEQELPQQVDTEQDAGLLQKFGLDPKDLINLLSGGAGGGLGGGGIGGAIGKLGGLGGTGR